MDRRSDAIRLHRRSFVGRAEQLEAFARRLDRLTGGRGGVLLIGGEAGVGKSAFVSTALEQCTIATYRAAARSGEPYAPVVSILRARERSTPGSLAATGPLWPYLATLLPEVGPVPAAHNALALADALADAMRALARSEPAVVLLDDLQCSDEATLELLPPLATTLGDVPLLVVGCYRTDEVHRGHALRRLRAELRRRHRLEELQIDALGESEAAELIARITGTRPSAELARSLYDRTGGVPFFLDDVTAALQSRKRLVEKQGVLELTASDVPLPETIRDAVRLRTDRLSDDARQALELAAAAGTQIDLSLLTDAEVSALEESIRVGLLHEAASRAASFRHALVREGVYADTPWSRRRACHRRIAQHLETHAGSSEVIAEHWVKAHENERARAQLIKAAEAFCAVHAHRDAARVSRRALELWPESVDEDLRLLVLQRSAECAELSGDLAEAVRAWEEVLDAYGAAGRNDLSGDVARRLAGAYDLLGMPQRTRTAREQAAAAFEATGRIADAVTERIAIAERLELAGSGAAALAMVTSLEGAIAQSGSLDLRIRAIALEGEFRAKLGEREKGVARSREAIELALRSGGATSSVAEAYYRLGAALENACDHDGAVEAYTEARGFCLGQDIAELAQICLACMLPAVLFTGQWSRTLDIARLVLRSPDSPMVARMKAKAHIGIIAALRGDAARAWRLCQEAYVFSQQTMLVPIEAFSTWGLIRAAELKGDIDEALERAREFARRAVDRDELHYTVPALRTAATLFARHGQERDIATCAEVLSRIAAATGHPEALGPLAHALGELALKRGEPEAAVEQFERALLLLNDAGVPYERAETQLRAGVALAAAGRNVEALERLTGAYRTAKKLAARPLASEATAVMQRLDEPAETQLSRRSAEAANGGLSARELEVLRLATEGLSNREIADRLFVSKRTVDMHMRNVLSRLGVRSRVEAAGRARNLQML